MAGFRDVTAWCRAHPLLLDVPLAAATFAVPLFVRPRGGAEQMFQHTGSGTVLVVGLACLGLVVRRRFPVPVWALTVALALANVVVVGGSTPALVPALVGIYTLVVSRPARESVPAAVGSTLLITVAVVVTGPTPRLGPATYAVLSWCALSAALAAALRNRRAVLAAAEERAVRAEQGREEEALRRVAEERLRIARELHDVLAHQISVINVQTGVARHLLHSDPEAATRSMDHVREASQLVLSEMPTILGLLRTDENRVETAPTPGLAQLDQLVESMRRAGLDVSWRVSGRPVTLPPSTDLTAYRLVQEALTNAHKHGLGGAEVDVAYDDDSVVLTVRNPLAEPGAMGAGAAVASGDQAGAGHGLIGMQERVSAVGGRLRVGPSDPGTFLVRAELSTGAVA